MTCVRVRSRAAVAARLAVRPVYPRLLTTCRAAQLGGLGPTFGLMQRNIKCIETAAAQEGWYATF
jgi:hypothetical protein